jgi:hydroxyacylglutathione hydrolase
LPGAVRNVTPDRWLEEGEKCLSPARIRGAALPGHAPGHVVFYNREAGFAHVGDVLFRGSIGRTDLPGGDHATLIASIKEKLLPLGDDIGFICGHGPGGQLGEERRTNPFLA